MGKKRGRSGNSQHVYERGLGAVDVSILNYTDRGLNDLEAMLMDYTEYKRVARYKTFIHVDLKKPKIGGRAYYRNTRQGWIYQGQIKQY